jgi:hypothetical protein
MHITELGLTAASQAALEAAGLTDVQQLITHPADNLLPQVAHIGPMELYEIISCLNQHGYSLPPVPNGAIRVPDDRHRDMLRLRIIEGLPMSAIGQQTGVKQERVRQLLRFYFGLSGTPPAVRAQRQRARQG